MMRKCVFFICCLFSLSALAQSKTPLPKNTPINKEWGIYHASFLRESRDILHYTIAIIINCSNCGISDAKAFYMGNRVLSPSGFSDGNIYGLSYSTLSISLFLFNSGKDEPLLDYTERIQTNYKFAFSYLQNGKKHIVGIPSKYIIYHGVSKHSGKKD